MDANGRDAVEFFTRAAQQGLMNGNTAGGLRAAMKEVLSSVEPDNWETLNIRDIDPDDYGARFERLRMTKFKPGSLQVYKSRFKNGRQMFLDYLESPSTWRYKAERPARERGKSKREVDDSTGLQNATSGQVIETTTPGGGTTLVNYTYPLRGAELMVSLRLPADLTRKDAQRLATFVNSLAIDDQAALPPGSND